jgi:hypothetical protein
LGDIDKEWDIHHSMSPDQTYVTGVFSGGPWEDDGRMKRFATKVVDCDGGHVCDIEAGQLIIRQTEKRRQEIRALFFDDDRSIKQLIFQRFMVESGKPKKESLSFSGEEIEVIRWILEVVRKANIDQAGKIHFSDAALKEMFEDEADMMRFVVENRDRLKHFDAAVDMAEYWEFCARKRELDVFEGLLTDPGFFSECKEAWNADNNEAVWQKFFEKNPWIFGLGLTPISLSNLPGLKLEQVVRGFSVDGEGKRVDALMRTNGALSALCFVEIKTHETTLISTSKYRPGTWGASPELAGAVSQCHVTVQATMNELKTKLDLSDRDGAPSGESFYLYQPRSFLVAGMLKQFQTENGPNEIRYRSFELFRRHLNVPEIVTFDELFQRAKATVQLSEPRGY